MWLDLACTWQMANEIKLENELETKLTRSFASHRTLDSKDEHHLRWGTGWCWNPEAVKCIARPSVKLEHSNLLVCLCWKSEASLREGRWLRIERTGSRDRKAGRHSATCDDQLTMEANKKQIISAWNSFIWLHTVPKTLSAPKWSTTDAKYVNFRHIWTIWEPSVVLQFSHTTVRRWFLSSRNQSSY